MRTLNPWWTGTAVLTGSIAWYFGGFTGALFKREVCLPYPTPPRASLWACKKLEESIPDTVLWPGSVVYDEENRNFWSPTAYGKPACVFLPRSAVHVAQAVSIFVEAKAEFAVRGGGHMPIPGYANTDGGVLVALSRLNEIELAKDNSFVSVGPGATWREVYNYLEPHGLVALGGRVGLVGVPGLILGGGISFYSNQYGFASDNVLAFEVVLADGSVVTATANERNDLFWALKGGANSFGIVTRFDLETYLSPDICAGLVQIAPTGRDAFLNAVANFAQYGSADAKAAVIPSIFILASPKTTVYTLALFYDGSECEQPALANFTAIPALDTSYGPTTLAKYIASTDALIPPGVRQEFHVVSSFATMEAIEIVHDTFVSMVDDELGDVVGLQASVAFQPVSKNFIQQGINKGGNPQGVDVDEAPYFWMVQNLAWSNACDDKRIGEFMERVTRTIDDKLQVTNQKARYQYLNDASRGQGIFQTYPPENVERLKRIREMYDPSRVFTDLMPGGWKVANS